MARRLLAPFLAAFMGFWLSAAALADMQDASEAYRRGDFSAALKEWQQLAEQGNAKAQLSLGTLYYVSKGAAQNYAEAARWYRKSAEQGDAAAQYNLGLMYHEGEGVSRNYAEAAR